LSAKTFLRNHADGVAAMDLFVVPTVSFRLLYGLLIMSHGRRQILWLGVTAQPTAEWIANQLTAACGWEQIPRDLIRDRDACYGSLFVRRVRDHPISPRSAWQNGYAERLIGSIRRECLDHIVVTGEQHLRHVLKCYMEYYNVVRTHLSLGKDAPIWRDIQCAGCASKCGLCLVDCTISTRGFDLRYTSRRFAIALLPRSPRSSTHKQRLAGRDPAQGRPYPAG
jgi:Integrase core domain